MFNVFLGNKILSIPWEIIIKKLATQVKINVEDGTLEEELNECLRDTLRFGGYTNGIAVDLSNSTSRSRILLGEFLNVVYCGCDDYNTPRREGMS